MSDVVRLNKILHGARFSVGFEWPQPGFSFSGLAVRLALEFDGTRLTFSESGCKKTVNGQETILDTIPAAITNSNQRISWTRSADFVAAHFSPGLWRGALLWGSTESTMNLIVEIQQEVSRLKGGRVW